MTRGRSASGTSSIRTMGGPELRLEHVETESVSLSEEDIKMGIDGINSYLKKRGVEFTSQFPITAFSGKRVAKDALSWFYTNLAISHKEAVLNSKDPLEIDLEAIQQKLIIAFLNFNLTWLQAGVTPVWIWDGPSPDEKKVTRAERRSTREKQQDKIAILRAKIEAETNLLDRAPYLAEYRAMLAMVPTIRSEDIETVQGVAESLGLPSILAPGDGEAFCASLACEGHVAAVWSTDTDNYALGTPIQITKFAGRTKENVYLVEAAIIPDIRDALGMTQEQLRDLCIMAGCDFNTNIPQVGIVGAMKLLEKSDRTIEGALALLEQDPKAKDKCTASSCLNFARCRELLTPPAIDIDLTDRLNVSMDKFNEVGRDLLVMLRLEAYIPTLISHYMDLPAPTGVEFNA